MLRSTGFFLGIDCPFYTDSCNVKSVKDGCKRPYCHFRHSQQRRASYGSNDIRKSNELYSKQKEQCGYDPFKPEVVRHGEPAAATVDMGALELELVNRAIEEVRSEVEREKKKLSRIGDQEYDPTDSSPKVVTKWPKPLAVTSHLAYDPGSYQMTTTADYNPTPRSSKYTLDSDSKDNHASSMEYVPTSVTKIAVKKPVPRTQTPQLHSLPTSLKYSTIASCSKNKYTVDHSKPSTDMEYDPLCNYSAKIAGKNKKPQRTGTTKGEGKKRPHLSGTGKQSTDEEYVPTIKKPWQVIPDPLKYTASFSESDEESSGIEYRPTSLSRLQRRKSSSGSVEEASGPGKGERAEGAVGGLKQQRSQESKKQQDATHWESEDLENQEIVARQKDKPETEIVAGKTSLVKSSKVKNVHKYEKESSKKSGGGAGGSSNKKGAGDGEKISDSKKSSHEAAKRDRKNQGKKEEKCKIKDTSIDKGKEGKGDKRSDGKSKIRTDTFKGESSKRENEREKGGGDNKLQTSDKGKDSKFKEHKNGKYDSNEREKDSKKVSKGSSKIGKDQVKKSSSSSSDGKPGKVKQRSLSHVDLFGDESVEEESDEEEETIVRKSVAPFKRGSLTRRNVSELTPSSSEDEDVGAEDDGGYGDMDDCGVDYSSLQVDMDFDLDDDPMEECLRIFNESKDVKTEDKGRQAKPSKDSEDEDSTESNQTTLFPGQRKRVSHFSAKGSTEATPKPPPYRRLTAQEICYQRMQIAQQQAAQLAAAVKTASTPSPFPGERKRVAHRPTPLPSSSKSGLAVAKSAGSRVLSPTSTLPAGLSVKAQTSAGILSKTTTTIVQKRVAHTPTMKSSAMKRPVIPTTFGAKVPTNVRQRYLNTFIDECMKFCPSEDLAFQMALEEEKVVYDRSSSKNIYLNVAVNSLKKLRSKSSSPNSLVAMNPAVVGNRKSQSHEEVLGGRLAAKTSFTINRTGKQQAEKLSGATLYRKLRDYLMTEERLQEHGYPRPHPESSGRAVVHNFPEKNNVDRKSLQSTYKPFSVWGWIQSFSTRHIKKKCSSTNLFSFQAFAKVCCRCGAEYKINANGNCVRKEECNHHWGRLRRHKVSGGWETNYNCCSGTVGSPGCSLSKQHVQDGRKESLGGYVQTFEKQLPPDGNCGVYALDCEMCYTKQGLELTRVTVINSELKVIYDTFVKPESKVVDYNTRFSGVTEEDLENASITLRDVQAVMLNMFNAESILIGHSLESDLFALKVIHSTVVDTAIVFPHRLGLPYKRALRNLMADHLKRIIQDSVEGHDSSEDACACMELMMWKIREDAKVKR
ncbi:RNA exonuclease 1 homolog isoform X1 [Oncorhynchus tshawytscha]|uniref:RNA exonuclease 1 homolog isoform X1 n=1 Tax=Oncorhynchus tshawytscha TaxID=74940 RepID=UPI000D099A1B|nr:RNA exonuclease 1 homolog isoform X1 [Oncorhynchus tshawytscha]